MSWYCKIIPSISPSSILKPRIFTCWSILPKYSIFPSGSHRAKSPERYSFPCPKGLSINFCFVRFSLFKYPFAIPIPDIHSSPGTPIPHIFTPFKIKTFELHIGFPMGIFVCNSHSLV